MTQADPATVARNLTAVRRFVDGVLGSADPAAFAEVVAEGVVVDTGLKPDGRINGREEYDRIMVRFEASADNTGALNGVAATGRRFAFCELHLVRFEDGKLVENPIGGLNPLMYETWQAPAMAPLLLEAGA